MLNAWRDKGVMQKNTFVGEPIEKNDETAAERIGKRIREIRIAKDMTQNELGKAVGIDADRIHKYEKGVRKPKGDLLNKIATALDVNTLALIDPTTTNCNGAMFTMFELEKQYNMHIEKLDGKLCLTADNRSRIYRYMEEWYNKYVQTDSEIELANSEEEKKEIVRAYEMWKWNYPEDIDNKADKEKKKRHIKKTIEELQEIYNKLD